MWRFYFLCSFNFSITNFFQLEIDSKRINTFHGSKLCILWGKQFEDTFENAQWRKNKQLQPMWLCILKCRQFEEAFENTQWWKVKQMQPVWFCNLSGKPNQCNQFDFACNQAGNLRAHLKMHSGEKSNKCNQCDYASSQAGHLMRHLKTHRGEKSNKWQVTHGKC